MNARTLDTLTPFLIHMKRRAQDLRTPMQAVGEIMIASTQKTFQMQGRPERWKPLAPATVLARLGGMGRSFTKRARKAAVYTGSALTKRARTALGAMKILIDRSILLHSVSARASNKGVAWGTNRIQAALLNFGGLAGRGHKVKIKARPFIGPPFEEDWDDIREILAEWVGLTKGVTA